MEDGDGEGTGEEVAVEDGDGEVWRLRRLGGGCGGEDQTAEGEVVVVDGDEGVEESGRW